MYQTHKRLMQGIKIKTVFHKLSRENKLKNWSRKYICYLHSQWRATWRLYKGSTIYNPPASTSQRPVIAGLCQRAKHEQKNLQSDNVQVLVGVWWNQNPPVLLIEDQWLQSIWETTWRWLLRWAPACPPASPTLVPKINVNVSAIVKG